MKPRERIPLHDHSDNDSGGRIDSAVQQIISAVQGTVTTSGGAATLDELLDVDVSTTTPAAGDRLRYNGSAWVNSSAYFALVTAYDGTNWLPLVDGDGNAIMTEVS